ncbi:uncharacterized protein LOC128194097 isoform X3 [Vigna angularis]|uniref:uncharacterized protein LOC128194097 isoform X3 n=1 Tax=Phaseolus angularis TaxID=3914 RepID=UPI0022B4C591|nr:uncharacterized protein LOC128194097 isoform X3 [Vigna angularis]
MRDGKREALWEKLCFTRFSLATRMHTGFDQPRSKEQTKQTKAPQEHEFPDPWQLSSRLNPLSRNDRESGRLPGFI